jgi:hypothetical protein
MRNSLALLALALALPLPGRAFFAGPLPADNVSLRGYAMPADGAQAAADGAWAYELGFDAANYWNYESGAAGYVRQIFETQTLAFSLRRGFTWFLPAEAGLRLSAQQSGEGMLNGFIGGFESGMARLFNSNLFINDARTGPHPLHGSSDIIAANGRLRQRQADTAIGAGDTALTLKFKMPELGPLSSSSRLFANLPTAAIRSSNAFLGLGFAADLPTFSPRLLIHADARAVVPFAAQDDLGLPLLPLSVGGTLGFEWNPFGQSSLGLHANFNQSPYQPTGLRAFDTPENDLALGLNQGFRWGARSGKIQLWGREDFFYYSNGHTYWFPYAPPDFQTGLKISFQ